MKDLSGVFVPITTPFDRQNEQVDYGAVRSNTKFLLDQGAAGLLVAGSTGEAPLLLDAEVKSLEGELRTIVPEDKWLIVGAGRESTAATVSACRAAWESGADAVLIRAPSYFASALTERTLLDHFKRIADESPLPVLLYNMPKYTHVNFAPSLIASLADHKNIIGAKDSSGDLDNLKSYRDAAPNWSILVGSGAAFLRGLELGALGGILAVGNFALELTVGVFDNFKTGDLTAAKIKQTSLTNLHQEIVAKYGPAGVKIAMDIVGLAGGPVRAPLGNLSGKTIDPIRQLLTEAMHG
jgi:4-hydroxy-2-oxoglutarate aldolase